MNPEASGDSTAAVYEERAAEWRERRERSARSDRPARLAADVAARYPGGRILDAGCGPGWHSAELGPAVVAFDIAQAMLEMVGEYAPDATPVRGDLGSLPFRSQSFAGIWASKSYVHVPRGQVPLALADLHRATAVGGLIELVLFAGDDEHAPFSGDDFAGRRFSLWPVDLLRRVIAGAGFAVDEWEELPTRRGDPEYRIRCTRSRTLPDYVAPGMRLLVCGMNPSLHAADAGVGFARPGNRFWPAALAAGLASADREPRHALREHHLGMTDLVKRATANISELSTAEYQQGRARIEALVRWMRPDALCVVGLTGWRAAADRRAQPGVQHAEFGGRPVYVMPNTSGANAHTDLEGFTAHLRAASELADRARR